MNLKDVLEFLLEDPHEGVSATRGSSRDESPDRETPDFFRDPSHVCRSCGEEYDLDRDAAIDACRSCGGVKVERA